MPKKGYKIKRYHRSYSRYSPGVLWLRRIGALALICVLGFIGWSAYGPVMEYLTREELPVHVTSSVPSSSSAEESPSSSPSSSQEEQEQAQPTVSPAQSLKAVYLPTSLISDSNQLQAQLTALSAAGYNGILFDLKDSNGNILYQSGLEQVAEINAQVSNPFNLSAVCQTMTASGFTPIGRIHAFRDPIASSRIEDAGVQYKGSNILWLDNSLENGGRSWLDPYSPQAKSYLNAIVQETIPLGIQQIVMDSVHFPMGYGLELTQYAADSATVSKGQALSNFLSEAQTAAGQIPVTLYLSGPGALGQQNTYYGGTPLDLWDSLLVDATLSQFSDGLVIDGQTPIEANTLTPQFVLETMINTLAPYSSNKSVIYLLPSSPSIDNTYIEEQSSQNVLSLLEILTKYSIENFVLYHPNGSYPAL